MKIKIININKEIELFENCDFCDNRFAKYDDQFKDKICDICINISHYAELYQDDECKNINQNL